MHRVYNGTRNVSLSGKACLEWNTVDHKFGNHVTTGDANFCRNPQNSETVEWCYVSPTEKEDCGVRTCGKKTFHICYLGI